MGEKAALPRCENAGENPEGKPCEHYVHTWCRSQEECVFQTDKSKEEIAAKKETVEVPDRVLELLGRIASGNVRLDEQFIDADVQRTLFEAASLVSTYDPTSDNFIEGKLSSIQDMEMDGLKLAAMNTRIGQVLGMVAADVEGAEYHVKEITAAKELAVEHSLKSGLRGGGVSERRIKAIVLGDPQVLTARDTLLQAKRRLMIVDNLCDRIESTINMIKKRSEGLRRELWANHRG